MGRKLSKRLESPWNTIMGSPGGSDNKSAWNAGDQGSVPGLRRSPEEKNGCHKF